MVLGAPSKKLVLGIPLYGRTFTLRDSSKTGIGDYHSGPGVGGRYTQEPGMLGYNEVNILCLLYTLPIQYIASFFVKSVLRKTINQPLEQTMGYTSNGSICVFRQSMDWLR